MTNAEAARTGNSERRLGLKYAHERLCEMFLAGIISGPMKRPVQLAGQDVLWASNVKSAAGDRGFKHSLSEAHLVGFDHVYSDVST